MTFSFLGRYLGRITDSGYSSSWGLVDVIAATGVLVIMQQQHWNDTYTVSGGPLNSAQSNPIQLLVYCWYITLAH